MQNKKLKNQLKKDIRRLHERVGAIVLLIATLIGLVSVSHQTRSILKEVALKPAFSIINDAGRENETARMPVRYDSVLKLQTVGGR